MIEYGKNRLLHDANALELQNAENVLMQIKAEDRDLLEWINANAIKRLELGNIIERRTRFASMWIYDALFIVMNESRDAGEDAIHYMTAYERLKEGMFWRGGGQGTFCPGTVRVYLSTSGAYEYAGASGMYRLRRRSTLDDNCLAA